MKNIDYKKVIFSITFLCIAAIGVMAFFVIYIWQMQSMWHFSAEYRDGVMIKLVDDFAKGINPFSLDTLKASMPTQTVDSGFLNIYLAVILVRIFGIPSAGAVYLTNMIYLLLIVWALVQICINLNTPQTKVDYYFVIAEALFGSTCILFFMKRVVYLVARPDIFSVLCILVIIDLFTKKEIRRCYIVITALLCVLIAFAKAHYAVILVAVILYLFFNKDKKKAGIDILIFGISGIVFTIIAFAVCQRCYPTYLSEWIPRLFAMITENQEYYSANTEYVISKYITTAKMLWAILIFIVCGLIVTILELKKRKIKVEKATLFVLLNIFVNFIVLSFVGRHRGTELSYFFMMLVPSVIIISLRFLYILKDKKIIYILVVIGIFYCVQNLCAVYKDADMLVGKKSGHNEIYSLLDNYTSDDVFLSPYISCYCINNGIENYNYGDSFYIAEDYVINNFYDKFPVSERLLPYSRDILNQHIIYQDVILNKIRNKRYSVIVLDNLDSVPHLSREAFNEELTANYVNIKEIEGDYGLDVTFSFWVPRDMDADE